MSGYLGATPLAAARNLAQESVFRIPSRERLNLVQEGDAGHQPAEQVAVGNWHLPRGSTAVCNYTKLARRPPHGTGVIMGFP